MNDKVIIRNQIALFNLLGAMAEKITGQIPSASIESEDGSIIRVTPSTVSILWYQGDSQGLYQLGKEKPKHR